MKRESLTNIKINEFERKKMLEEIKAFYNNDFDENIGIIKQEQILKFILDNVGPIIYNKALDEAKIWFQQKLENMNYDYELMHKEVR